MPNFYYHRVVLTTLESFDTSDLEISKVLVDERSVDVGSSYLARFFDWLCLFQTVEVRPWSKARSDGLSITRTSPSMD